MSFAGCFDQFLQFPHAILKPIEFFHCDLIVLGIAGVGVGAFEEFDFRYNERNETDSERTESALRGIRGKRLTYQGPIEKVGILGN